ncbi:hypothetical protein AB4524_00700 [Vibrio breoganii]
MMKALSKMNKKDKQGVALFSVAITILVILLSFYLYKVNSPERKYDRNTMCNEHITRDKNNIFIFDISDPLSNHQKVFLKKRFNSVLAESSINDKFTIFTLDAESNGLSQPISMACMPKGAKDANQLTDNAKFLEKNFQDKFIEPMNESLNVVSSENTMETSPIFESLSDVNSLGFLDRNSQVNNVYIISDMLQNTDKYSVYRSGSSAVSDLPYISLPNTKVMVFWLERNNSEKYQTSSLAKSWARYIDSVSTLSFIEKVRD